MKTRISGLFCLVLMAIAACSKSEAPVLGQLPEFKLTDQDKKPFGLGDLKGKVWVANFIFTSCAGTCPVLTQRMTQVQERLSEMKQARPDLPVCIVSFSVDPERDTPEKLQDYAQRFRAKPGLWHFLTGPIEQVEATVVHGFKTAMGKVEMTPQPNNPGETFDVVHGERFVLVDQQGRIRGYYDSENGREISRLLNDLQTLLKKAPS